MANTANDVKSVFRFSSKYFFAFVLLFIIEVIIALYVRDSIIRPYGGDVLVVILIYCFVKSFFNVGSLYLSIGVLLFAYLVEISQYFKLLNLLHLQDYTLIRIVLGASFSWGDMLAYTIGAAICFVLDKDQK